MNRRSLITGLVSLIAAPAIVRIASIMPVKPMPVGLHTGFYNDGSPWVFNPNGDFTIEYTLGDDGIKAVRVSNNDGITWQKLKISKQPYTWEVES